MAKRERLDWEKIERDYRAGQLSIREIATQHGCSDTAIRKKMKALGVNRDLTKQVAEKVRTDLVRAEVRTANPGTEKEIVEHAAAVAVEVVRSHRVKIGKGTAVVDKIWRKLDEDAKRKGDDAAPVQALSSAAVNLSNALAKLISLERQAFSIKDETESTEGITVTLSSDDMAL